MDKIAIISDVHGNLEALKTVFADIESQGISKIYCLGDIVAKGSNQNDCVNLIREKCEVVIQGNCEKYFTIDFDLSKKSQVEIERITWNRQKFNEKNIDYLRNLPICHEFYMSGRMIRLVHAHPAEINKFIGNVDKLDRLYELFMPSDKTISNEKADILIYGHIHTPYIQRIYNRTIINVGSAGNSIDIFRNEEKDGNIANTTVANYLILTGTLDSKKTNDRISFELVSIPYDIEKELSSNEDNIEYELYKEELTKGKYRDMKKIYENYDLIGVEKHKV